MLRFELVYVLNTVLLLLYTVFFKKVKLINVSSQRLYLFLSSLQISLIVGLRDGVGTDWSTYEKMYYYYGNGMHGFRHYDRVEIGFKMISSLLWKMGIPFWFANLLMIVATMFFITKCMEKLSVDVYMSMYLYVSFCFVYFAMNMMRQGLAMAIGMYAICHLAEHKRVSFVVFVLIGALFHYVILMFLPLAFISNKKISISDITKYGVACALLYAGFGVVLNIVSHTIYSFYLNSAYENRGMSIYINLAVRLLLIIIVVVYLDSLNDEFKNNLLIHMVIWCTILQVLTTKASMFGRTTTPFFLPYVVLIPEIAGVSRRKKLVNAGIYIAATLYHIVYFSVSGSSVLGTTYKTIFH